MYIKLQNGQPLKFPYSLGELRRDNPGTSFPTTIPSATLAEYGVFPVAATQAPTFDNKAYKLKQTAQLIDGRWTQQWEQEQLPEDQAATNMRNQRDQLLIKCDWTQLPDSPLDADGKLAWALYRETLRMIPQQDGFPWGVQWPPEPQ